MPKVARDATKGCALTVDRPPRRLFRLSRRLPPRNPYRDIPIFSRSTGGVRLLDGTEFPLGDPHGRGTKLGESNRPQALVRSGSLGEQSYSLAKLRHAL